MNGQQKMVLETKLNAEVVMIGENPNIALDEARYIASQYFIPNNF
jgi:hypothetical protein